jgi:hypothetical protein
VSAVIENPVIALAAAGLTPTSPVIAEAGTVETPDFASATKWPEAPSATARRLGLPASRLGLASLPLPAATSPQAAAADTSSIAVVLVRLHLEFSMRLPSAAFASLIT